MHNDTGDVMTVYQFLHHCLDIDAKQTGPPPERVMEAVLRAVRSNNTS